MYDSELLKLLRFRSENNAFPSHLYDTFLSMIINAACDSDTSTIQHASHAFLFPIPLRLASAGFCRSMARNLTVQEVAAASMSAAKPFSLPATNRSNDYLLFKLPGSV